MNDEEILLQAEKDNTSSEENILLDQEENIQETQTIEIQEISTIAESIQKQEHYTFMIFELLIIIIVLKIIGGK